MKRKTINNILATALIAAVFSSCKKDDTVTPTPVVNPVQTAPALGEYILSEGNYGSNNTKLSYYSNATGMVTGDFFLQQNPAHPAGLGDTGNDMIIYGSKLYIVVNISQNVTVLDASNATFIKQIDFTGATKQPRYAIGARGKIYVTAYDNTVSVIDTTSLTIVQTINAGADPEGIAVSGDYLYVANSGAFNPSPDSTVSQIDINTGTEIRKIKVGVNPNKIAVNTSGKVYVSAYGNFGSIPASVSVINGPSATTSTDLGSGFQYSHLRIFNDTAYFYNNYGGTGTSKVYNTASNSIIRNEFITDGTTIQNPYGINIDEQNGDVYITDAVNYSTAGKVTCFSSAGVKKFSFSTAPGISPNKVVFRR